MTTREELLYIAKFTEQTQRFQSMVDAIRRIVQMGQELSTEQRSLLSVAYKNYIGSKRTAWRGLNSLEKKDQIKNPKNVHLIKEHKKIVEDELNRICNQIISMLDQILIPGAKEVESQVFYLKMKGDYYRYAAEHSTGQAHKKASENANEAYITAQKKASQLKATHPIRLGLALNLSVFYYQVLNDPARACKLAKQAFDEAIGDIQKIQEQQYKDATSIMQLIKDNLSLWTSDLQEEEENRN